jgi:Protein of unknown function (DUF2750)
MPHFYSLSYNTMAQLRPEEIDKIFKKPGEKRYDYFIKTVADTEEVYGLADEEGWLLLGEGEEAEDDDILPLFPGAEFAERFRVEHGFEEYGIGVVDVNELLEWLGEMQEDGMLVAVFPDLIASGVVIPPEGLKADLMTELEKYDEDGKKIRKPD